MVENALTGLITYLYKSKDPGDLKQRACEAFVQAFPEDLATSLINVILQSLKDTGQPISVQYAVEHHGLTVMPVGAPLTFPDVINTVSVAAIEENKSKVAAEILEVAKNIQGLSPAEIRERIDKATGYFGASTEKKEVLSGGELYALRKTRPAGPLTFIDQVDQTIRGGELGTVMTVAAFVASFKTTFGVNFAYSNSVDLGYNGGYFTLEIPKELLQFMLISRHSFHPKWIDQSQPVAFKTIRESDLTDDQEKFLFEVVEPDLFGNPDYGKIVLYDEADFVSMQPRAIRNEIERNEFRMHYLVVDYIQLFRYVQEALANPRMDVNYFVRMFAEVAKSGDPLFTLLLSQVNREGWKSAVAAGGVYAMTALSDANELERSSRYVMFFFTDDAMKEIGEVKVQLLKHTFGDVIPEPVITQAEPRYCAFGSLSGFKQVAQSDFTSLFAEPDFGGIFDAGV